MIEIHVFEVTSIAAILISSITLILTQRRLNKTDTVDSTEEITKLKLHCDGMIERMSRCEKSNEDNKISIERRNEEMKWIHKHIVAIDALKLDAELALIKTDLKHIRALLEKK